MNGEGAVREACERVFRPRVRMPNHTRDIPQPLRTNFGEIKIFDFEILLPVVRFGPPLPFLGLSCVQSAHKRGTLIFLWNLPEINGF